jgi:hypothetical protein
MAETLRRELEASGPKDRLRQFTFNVFDVDLDFQDDTAAVHDVLDADRSQTYPMSELRARLPGAAAH